MRYGHWVWKSEIASDVCDRIISEHKDGVSEGVVVNNEPVLDREVRRSKTSFDVSPAAREICRDYILGANRSAFGVDLSGFIEAQFTVYEGDENGCYDWHTDSYELPCDIAFNRKLSCVIALSDPADYEGGEFYLGYRSDPFKFSKGDVIVFPSFQLHKVAPVTRGTRYTLVSWAEGPHWR